eukprot:SAG31_NODE_6243_length_2105_cov_1.939681_2_plen_132_part_00
MGALDPFARLILFVAYATYTVVGAILGILAVAYVAEIDGGNDYVTYSLGGAALVMLGIGSVALYATWKDRWQALALVELCNLGLFALILAAATIAFSKKVPTESRSAHSTHVTAHSTHVTAHTKMLWRYSR